jgi:hypothetical protein
MASNGMISAPINASSFQKAKRTNRKQKTSGKKLSVKTLQRIQNCFLRFLRRPHVWEIRITGIVGITGTIPNLQNRNLE